MSTRQDQEKHQARHRGDEGTKASKAADEAPARSAIQRHKVANTASSFCQEEGELNSFQGQNQADFLEGGAGVSALPRWTAQCELAHGQ